MDRKTFLCIFFSLGFSSFLRNNASKKRWRNKRVLLSKQKGSFVSPSTREQQRKPLVNLTFFEYVISQKRRENQQKKYREIFSY